MISSSRRFALLGLLIPILSVVPAGAADFDPGPVARAVEDVETRLSARVGVAIMDTQTGKTWSNRGDERFPLNSTFKALLCAALLDAAEKGTADAKREVVVQESDIVSYSPVLEKHVGGKGFSIGELCEVTVTTSDNAAANLVMAELGGPEGVTAYLRRIGDDKTRIDRWEPDSNTGVPGDPRDTTTPWAAAETLRKLVLGDALEPQARVTLTSWLEGNKVGNSTLRAGIPKNWRIADKTGAGSNGSRNNIAVIWPENRDPVVIAIYITQTTAAFQTRNAAIAGIGAALAESID
ncbi:MAG: class A beta-lactamase [Roseibium sp.]|uniref:class A beta-lactamase n=1 Tax=Roseibium sp. TaxID=1936156 RepID=UPI003D9BFFA4